MFHAGEADIFKSNVAGGGLLATQKEVMISIKRAGSKGSLRLLTNPRHFDRGFLFRLEIFLHNCLTGKYSKNGNRPLRYIPSADSASRDVAYDVHVEYPQFF